MRAAVNPFHLISDKSYDQLFQDMSSTVSHYSAKGKLKAGDSLDLIHNSSFLNFVNSSPHITCLVDFQSQNYLYISDNLEHMWGYNIQDFYQLGFVKGITLFPPEQAELVVHKIFPIMFEYFNELALTGGLEDVRISYNTKIIKADGTESWFLHQVQVLHTDEYNRPSVGIKFMSDITEFKKDESIHLVIARKKQKGAYETIFSQTLLCDNKNYSISVREKEILSLLGQGKSSHEIGEALFISEHTVKTHRKNILKKLEAKSTGELLKKAIVCGLI